MGKDISRKWKGKRKAGVAILISDKMDFRISCNKRQRRALYDDKEINPTREYDPCKHFASNGGAPKYINQI